MDNREVTWINIVTYTVYCYRMDLRKLCTNRYSLMFFNACRQVTRGLSNARGRFAGGPICIFAIFDYGMNELLS